MGSGRETIGRGLSSEVTATYTTARAGFSSLVPGRSDSGTLALYPELPSLSARAGTYTQRPPAYKAKYPLPAPWHRRPSLSKSSPCQGTQGHVHGLPLDADRLPQLGHDLHEIFLRGHGSAREGAGPRRTSRIPSCPARACGFRSAGRDRSVSARPGSAHGAGVGSLPWSAPPALPRPAEAGEQGRTWRAQLPIAQVHLARSRRISRCLIHSSFSG